MGTVGRRWGRADPPLSTRVLAAWNRKAGREKDTDLVESRLHYYGVKQEPYYFISHQLRFHWCFSKVKKQSLTVKSFLLQLTVLLSPRDINGITFTSHIREKSEARKMYAQAKAKGKAAGIVRYKDFGKGVLHQTHSKKSWGDPFQEEIGGGKTLAYSQQLWYLIFKDLSCVSAFGLIKHTVLTDNCSSLIQATVRIRPKCITKLKCRGRLLLVVCSQNNPTDDFSGAMPWIWKTSKPKWTCPQGWRSSSNSTTMKWFEGN